MKPEQHNSPQTYCATDLQWRSWMASGQQRVSQQDWESAVVCYRKAFELAEQLYCHNCFNSHCFRQSLRRYLTSADQYAVAIHHNNYRCALVALMSSLQLRQYEAVNAEQDTFNQLLQKIEQLISSD